MLVSLFDKSSLPLASLNGLDTPENHRLLDRRCCLSRALFACIETNGWLWIFFLRGQQPVRAAHLGNTPFA
jgi:hypothetical protein